MRLTVRKQVAWWGGAALVLVLVLWGLGKTITPFLMGAGIAYILDPVVTRLQRLGCSRTLAVVLMTLLAALLFVAGMLLLVPALVRQAVQLVQAAPEYFNAFQGFVTTRLPGIWPQGGGMATWGSETAQKISELASTALPALLDSMSSVLGVIVTLLIVPVVTFYLLLDWHALIAHVDSLLPRDHARTIRRLASEIDATLSGFLRGQGLVTLILGTFYAVALVSVGLPYGLVIGLMAAVLSIIPYLGVFVGGLTAIGVAAMTFWDQPLWIGVVAAIFAFGQMVEGNFLQPKIVGGSVGLHPVWLLLALSVFGAVFGFVGLIVAVPLAAASGVLARFAIARYRESGLYTGRVVPPEPSAPILVELVPRGTVAKRRALASVEKNDVVARMREEKAEKEAEKEAGRDDSGPDAAESAGSVVGKAVRRIAETAAELAAEHTVRKLAAGEKTAGEKAAGEVVPEVVSGVEAPPEGGAAPRS